MSHDRESSVRRSAGATTRYDVAAMEPPDRLRERPSAPPEPGERASRPRPAALRALRGAGRRAADGGTPAPGARPEALGRQALRRCGRRSPFSAVPCRSRRASSAWPRSSAGPSARWSGRRSASPSGSPSGRSPSASSASGCSRGSRAASSASPTTSPRCRAPLVAIELAVAAHRGRGDRPMTAHGRDGSDLRFRRPVEADHRAIVAARRRMVGRPAHAPAAASPLVPALHRHVVARRDAGAAGRRASSSASSARTIHRRPMSTWSRPTRTGAGGASVGRCTSGSSTTSRRAASTRVRAITWPGNRISVRLPRGARLPAGRRPRQPEPVRLAGLPRLRLPRRRSRRLRACARGAESTAMTGGCRVAC